MKYLLEMLAGLLDNHHVERELRRLQAKADRQHHLLQQSSGLTTHPHNAVETRPCLQAEVQDDFGGAPTSVELCPDGASVPVTAVTADNRQQYVEAYTQHLLTSSISRQFDAFARGFRKVSRAESCCCSALLSGKQPVSQSEFCSEQRPARKQACTELAQPQDVLLHTCCTACSTASLQAAHGHGLRQCVDCSCATGL